MDFQFTEYIYISYPGKVIFGMCTSCSIFLTYLEEDLHARYAQLMLKYFSAEGIVSGHALFIASADQDPHQIIQVCGGLKYLYYLIYYDSY